MRLSDDKINHLAHLVSYALDDEKDVRLLKDLNKVRVAIKDIMTRELALEDEIGGKIRENLLKRKRLLEGSEEYHILFQKEYEEELKRRRGF